jgi:hypothetical protein
MSLVKWIYWKGTDTWSRKCRRKMLFYIWGFPNVLSYLIDLAALIFQGRDRVAGPPVWVFAKL